MNARVIGLEDEEKMSDGDVQKFMDQIRDPLGTFHMFSLPCLTPKRSIAMRKSS